jgi:hypothetical protein
MIKGENISVHAEHTLDLAGRVLLMSVKAALRSLPDKKLG